MELSNNGKVKKRYIRGNDLVYADKGMRIRSVTVQSTLTRRLVRFICGQGTISRIWEDF